MSVGAARALGYVAVAVAMLEVLLFFAGIPPALALVLGSVPPVVAVLILYIPGPLAGLLAFIAWTNLMPRERRECRWVVWAAAAAMFVPMLPGLLLSASGLIEWTRGGR